MSNWAYWWNRQKGPTGPDYWPDGQSNSALAEWLALYAADENHERAVQLAEAERITAEVEEKYRFHHENGFYARQVLQENLLRRAQLNKETRRQYPLYEIRDNVAAQPDFIRKPIEQRIRILEQSEDESELPAYLNEIVSPCLQRLDTVRLQQMPVSFRHAAGRDGIDGLLRLPELNQKEVKRLSTLVAAHIDNVFIQISDAALACDDITPADILEIYRRVAAEVVRFDVIPPAYEALRKKRRRRKPINFDLIPGALARMRCADWWHRKLWQLRCEWREEQLRAAGFVHRLASMYVSKDIIMHKREQRRKALEFFRAHELVNEEGESLSMEDVINASASNPAHRRNEMMACVEGLRQIAEMRGDTAVFYTITCPSRFHATLDNGRPNPKWSTATVRQSSDYLVNMFAAFRKAMHKKELRWYGVRVAEPHHDGTVHWHMLCFMRKRDRRAITALLRKFAIREDRAELGKNVSARFKVLIIDKRKGSATGYIAKYVSKNIDGRGLGDTISKEGGGSLRDLAENVLAWASLHRVQQFRFFGIPSRQAYRELRLLAGQARRKLPPIEPNPDKPQLTPEILAALANARPVIGDPQLDAVLAAADIGCFATYITKQGGVLVPRSLHLIRTAYELTAEPGTYGDHCVRVYGVKSHLLPGQKICTHAHTWQMVKKQSKSAEGAQGNASCPPWTRGNNCPPEQKTDKKPPFDQWWGSLNHHERRAVARRISEEARNKTPGASPYAPAGAANVADLADFARSLGWENVELLARRLAAGGEIVIKGRRYFARDDGRIYSRPVPEKTPVSKQLRVWIGSFARRFGNQKEGI